MELVELKIHGISYSDNTSGAFELILDEVNGNKKLPIVIGGFEAQSIAIALEKKIKTSRPLTHELFKGFADKFDINLNHVIIHKLSEGVFYSNMVCEKDSEVVKIDSRTSDAIALSIRFNAPIFVTKEVLDEAGFEDDKRYSDGINLTDENFFKDNLSGSTDSKSENTKRSEEH
uniref:bifunctional nuclease family protein n=1 Tax=Winogradskyella sp. TaxID=1883156 RepID=UPI003519CC43